MWHPIACLPLSGLYFRVCESVKYRFVQDSNNVAAFELLIEKFQNQENVGLCHHQIDRRVSAVRASGSAGFESGTSHAALNVTADLEVHLFSMKPCGNCTVGLNFSRMSHFVIVMTNLLGS